MHAHNEAIYVMIFSGAVGLGEDEKFLKLTF